MPYTPSPLRFRTFARTVFGICALLLLCLYMVWQARFLLIGPELSLTEVPSHLSNERIVTLAGEAKNITRITLNGRQIFTDPSGHFKEALALENGYTIATIAATDRYGRTTEIRQPFIYTPASILE